MPLLDIDDIQGGLIAGYPTTHAAYVFLRFGTVTPEVRAWLSSVELTDARRQPGPRALTRNVAFTASGLGALGLPGPAMHALPAAFTLGMAARGSALGDHGPSAASAWEGWSRERVDAMLTVTAFGTAALRSEVDRLLQRSARPRDVHPVNVQYAAAIIRARPTGGARSPGDGEPRRFEHFGFRDGVSNPIVEGTDRRLSPGNGTLRQGRWHAIKPGEFLLGYEDETRVVDLPHALRPYFRNGSYLVWRKLRQDVVGFRRRYGDEPAQAALVGRWRDGSPLALTARQPAPDLASSNDFTYGGDERGACCPVSAHIRRSNPRGALDFADVITSRHRIIRRGMPYVDRASTHTDPTIEDPIDRGLIFVCFNADIERQFEFVQRRWLVGDPSRTPRGGRDPIAAPNAGGADHTFVTTRAGVYLFQPGLLGLSRLLRSNGAGS